MSQHSRHLRIIGMFASAAVTVAVLTAPSAVAAPATIADGGVAATSTEPGSTAASASATWPKRVGPAKGSTKVPVVLMLKQQVSRAKLYRLALAGPDRNGSHDSIRTVAKRTGATAQSVAAVRQFFASRGLRATIDVTRTYAHVRMNPAQLKRLFDVRLDRYREHPTACADPRARHRGGCIFVTPRHRSRPRIPASLDAHLTSGSPRHKLVGLTNRQVLRHSSTPANSASSEVQDAMDPTSVPWWRPSGTFEGCTAATAAAALSPLQLATAYGFPGGNPKVKPQTVGLLAFGQTVDELSVTDFAACFGLTRPTINTDDLVGGQDAGGEATLDAESLTAFGGGAIGTIHVAAGATPGTTATNLLAAVSNVLSVKRSSGGPVDIISISYASCEKDYESGMGSTISATELVLAKAAKAGVSVVAAAGDSGSSACSQENPYDTATAVMYPASSAWVTAVGGTSLYLNPDNSINTSGVWNDAILMQDGDTVQPMTGGGGGISTTIPRPTWQTGTGVDTTAKRQVPDVSFMADGYPGVAMFNRTEVAGVFTGWYQGNGTSFATPLFAAAVAQYNARHSTPLGLVNKTLYPAVANGSLKTYDITTGTNNVDVLSYSPFTLAQLDCCTATKGFDTASGWGSVMIDSLLTLDQ